MADIEYFFVSAFQLKFYLNRPLLEIDYLIFLFEENKIKIK